MIGLQDRQAMGDNIKAAWLAGSSLQLACKIVGIELNTPAALERSGIPHGGRWSACVCQSGLEYGRAQGAAGDDQKAALFLHVIGTYRYAARSRESAPGQRMQHGACCAQGRRTVHSPRVRQGSQGQVSAHRPHRLPCKQRHNALAASLLRAFRHCTQCSVQSFEALLIVRSITPLWPFLLRGRCAFLLYGHDILYASKRKSAIQRDGREAPRLFAINTVVFRSEHEQRAIWLPAFNLCSTNLCVSDEKHLHTHSTEAFEI